MFTQLKVRNFQPKINEGNPNIERQKYTTLQKSFFSVHYYNMECIIITKRSKRYRMRNEAKYTQPMKFENLVYSPLDYKILENEG